MENLPLKKTALRSLGLPIEVKSGVFSIGTGHFATLCNADWFGISAIKMYDLVYLFQLLNLIMCVCIRVLLNIRIGFTSANNASE